MTALDNALALTAAAAEKLEAKIAALDELEARMAADEAIGFVLRHPLFDGLEPLGPGWEVSRRHRLRLEANGFRSSHEGTLEEVISWAASEMRDYDDRAGAPVGASLR